MNLFTLDHMYTNYFWNNCFWFKLFISLHNNILSPILIRTLWFIHVILFLPLTFTVLARIKNTLKVRKILVMCIMFWDKLIIGFFKFSFCSCYILLQFAEWVNTRSITNWARYEKIFVQGEIVRNKMCPDLVSSLPWVFVFLCSQLKTEIITVPATGSPVIMFFVLGFNYLFCIHHHNIIIIKAKNEAK